MHPAFERDGRNRGHPPTSRRLDVVIPLHGKCAVEVANLHADLIDIAGETNVDRRVGV